MLPAVCRRAAQQGGGATQSVRMLRVDDTTVLKLAIGPSLAAVAVTTFQGLYLTDWSNPAGEPGGPTCAHFLRPLLASQLAQSGALNITRKALCSTDAEQVADRHGHRRSHLTSSVVHRLPSLHM